MRNERRVWAAMLFPSGAIAGGAVTGALRGSRRLHWTMREARAEAEQWAAEMSFGPIRWETLDDQMVIGRNHNHTAVLRSILLPEGQPIEFTARR
jgi:hypothetical protein